MRLRKIQPATNPELFRKFVKVSGVDPDEGIPFVFVGRVVETTADTFTVLGFRNDHILASSQNFWLDDFDEKGQEQYKIEMIGPFAEIEY